MKKSSHLSWHSFSWEADSTLLFWFYVYFADAENPEEVVDESIKHAREAITLDVKDGYSWCKTADGF